MKKEFQAGTEDEQRTTADNSTSASVEANPMLPAAMSVKQIMKLRNQLPDNWKWNKCYELSYISSRTGREFIKKHWALTSPDKTGSVHSLGLISHDCTSTKKDFFERDIPVEWVEKSLLIVDSLLAEIERLKGSRSIKSPIIRGIKL